MNKKGIVISPSFTVPLIGTGLMNIRSPQSDDLRKYLLYWDQIDYPSNTLLVMTNDDIEYLKETGSLKQTHVSFSGKLSLSKGRIFIAAQEAAFKKNQLEEPGCWTIAQLSNSPFYTQNTTNIGVEVELYNMLPVPSANTPLADILEFKEKRRDELIAFRIYMDEVNERIISSIDLPRAKNNQIALLEIAIRNVERTMKESGFRYVTTSLKNIINADFSGILGVGLGFGGLATVIGMSPLVAGVAGAGLVIGVKSLTMPSGNYPTNLSYINSIRNNFVK